jgi:hypothetical protein
MNDCCCDCLPPQACNDSSLATETAPESLGCNRGSDRNGTCVSQIISAVSNVGVGLAGAITGRPVVTTKQGNVTLGQKPLVTGQVQASSLLWMIALIAVAIAIVFVIGRKK